MQAGLRNDLTDVAGIRVGHHHRIGRGWVTGTTVVLPPEGTVGGVDVRGGGPGTRETDLLSPVNLVERVDAVCLSGGSAYGLAAASGVVEWLAARHVGFRVGDEPHEVVPIVPAAVVFDLGRAGPDSFHRRPDASFGRRAAARARAVPVAQGTVGAGAGTRAGPFKGGVGSASVVLDDGTTVAALVVLNAAGSPADLATGELYGARYGIGREFAPWRPPKRAEARALADTLAAAAAAGDPPDAESPLNTTLVVVATDAALDKARCTRLAGAAHDGLARALRPAHLLTDGDTAFALSTCRRPLPGPTPDDPPSTANELAGRRTRAHNAVFAAGADVVARAVVHATLAATSAGELRSYLDLLPSARRR